MNYFSAPNDPSPKKDKDYEEAIAELKRRHNRGLWAALSFLAGVVFLIVVL